MPTLYKPTAEVLAEIEKKKIKMDDLFRNEIDNPLSNEELMLRIHKQLADERGKRETFGPTAPDWNKLLQTKLISNPCFT